MRRIQSLLRHDLIHNTLALYGVQICRKLLPLVSIPYLTRVLKPTGWGTVAFVTSLGDFIVMAIEFGFNLSATREIAQNRESREQCGRIASGVFGSQLLIAVVAVTGICLGRPFLPVLRDHPSLFWAGLLYGVSQGLNPIWFFQGLENIRLAAAVEVIGKSVALLGLFMFVHNSGDEWRVLALQALPALLSTIVGFWLATRRVALCWPTLANVSHTLRTSFPMFLFRSGESLYGVGNAFVLGLFASPASVGYYSLAERIGRAMFGLMDPVRESIYPRLSHLAIRSQEKAAKLARLGAAVTTAGGVLLGVGMYCFAPLLIHLAGSNAFTPAVTVLRIFAILPVLLAVTHSIGIQWLLSLGRDRLVNRIIMSAGGLNLLLAVFLAPRFKHFGMAWAVVCAETFVCIAMVWTVRRVAPFWKRNASGSFADANPPHNFEKQLS
jgi:polysaccharide transporter, PST family